MFIPLSGQASTVLDALRFELERLQVSILTNAGLWELNRAERTDIWCARRTETCILTG